MTGGEDKPQVELVGDMQDAYEDYIQRRGTMMFSTRIYGAKPAVVNGQDEQRTGNIQDFNGLDVARIRSFTLIGSADDLLRMPQHMRIKLTSHRAEISRVYSHMCDK